MEKFKEAVKKNIIYLNIVITILVVVSIYFIIHNYLKEVTPELQHKMDKVNLMISIIFVSDLLLRLVVFGKPYLKSMEFVIDLMACLDITSPALKAARALKYSRILRMVRILRIFRGLKLFKAIATDESKAKLFNLLGVLTLVVFILLSMFVSNYLNKKFSKLAIREYQNFVNNVLGQCIKDGKINLIQFNKMILIRGQICKDIAGFSIKVGDSFQKFDIISEDRLLKLYYPDEVLKIKSDIVSVTFVSKMNKLYIRHIELLIILGALPLILIEFFVVYIIK